MSVLTQGTYLPDWLKWESDRSFSRERVTILAGSGTARVLTAGMVVAKVTLGAGSAAAVGGNTGNGTIGAITVTGAAKPGVYKAVCIEPATNAGKFTIEDPDGIIIGVATVAVAFSAGGLGFTIADGATDFVSGDAFDITVAAGSGKWVQLDLAGTNGSEDAAGILISDVTAPNGTDAVGAVLVRNAVIVAKQLTWPAGATNNQKNAALALLKAQGIVEASAA